MKLIKSLTLVAFVLSFIGSAVAQDAEALMKEAHLNYNYAKDDGKAKVEMTLVSTKGSTKTKKFSMVRKDLKDGGDQLYFIYFKSPSDIKRMTFLVKKNVDSDDDRMLYVPAIDLVKKIAASDKASSFVGSDFSYEDVSGRLWTEDNHELLGEEKVGEYAAFKIKSTPKQSDYFDYKISLISKKDKLPLREEYYDSQNNLMRVFTAEKIEVVQDVPTITIRKMENIDKQQHTIIKFVSIKYDIGIQEKYFSERYLKKPHISLK
ncbi:MAG: outer membrane lipoprotein-sorting protein [Calditrichaeota bacterium]|nr:MAG: outer membrane lipoprotein-sorting protein [Calditrichota bacterium]